MKIRIFQTLSAMIVISLLLATYTIAGSSITNNYLRKGYVKKQTIKVATKIINKKDDIVLLKSKDRYLLVVESGSSVHEVASFNIKEFKDPKAPCKFNPYIYSATTKSPCDLRDDATFGIGYEIGQNCRVSCTSYKWTGSKYQPVD